MPLINAKDAADARNLAGRLLAAAGGDTGRVRVRTHGGGRVFDVDDELAAAVGRAPDEAATTGAGGDAGAAPAGPEVTTTQQPDGSGNAAADRAAGGDGAPVTVDEAAHAADADKPAPKRRHHK